MQINPIQTHSTNQGRYNIFTVNVLRTVVTKDIQYLQDISCTYLWYVAIKLKRRLKKNKHLLECFISVPIYACI